jgi:hypothetical protein
MDVKEAIKRAKAYVADVFAEESIANIGLEEVRLDDENRNWLITIGFSRLSGIDQMTKNLSFLKSDLPRIYKVVKVQDHDGKLISISNRAVEN